MRSTIEQMHRDLFATQFEIERVRKLSREANNEIEYSMYIDELAKLINLETAFTKDIAERLGKKK